MYLQTNVATYGSYKGDKCKLYGKLQLSNITSKLQKLKTCDYCTPKNVEKINPSFSSYFLIFQ